MPNQFYSPVDGTSLPLGNAASPVPVIAERKTEPEATHSMPWQDGDTLPMIAPPPPVTRKPVAGLEQDIIAKLCCPRCQAPIEVQKTSYACCSKACGAVYPTTNHIPILVDPQKSVFDLSTFQRQDPTFFRPIPEWRKTLSEMIPEMSSNVAASRVYSRLRSLLHAENQVSNVLVVGGGVTGSGMEVLQNDRRIRLIETDAAVEERTQIICDAHDLPFADNSMDAVIVQAVLEHVVDPHRCVAELHRVLKPGGLVYSDTPFMQQVHGRQYDFTRFTKLGHRRLFRHFDEVESGITCGPGMALAWSIRYFLMSFSDNAKYRVAASGFARVMFWWLTKLDPFLVTKKAANDAASAFYFLGRKSESTLDDRQLLASYVGGQ